MSRRNNNRVNKRKYFSELMKFMPYCSSAVMITGVFANDAEDLFLCRKFDNETSILNFEHLKSNKWTEGITGQNDFLEKWNSRMEQIFGSKSSRRTTKFMDIFDSELKNEAGTNNELVLIDSCNKWDEKIADWIGKEETLDAIVEDGVLGLNVLMARTKIEGDSSAFSHPVSIIRNDNYSNENDEYEAIRNMYIIANAIEKKSNNHLRTIAMANYWDSKSSPMAYILFKKTSEI